MRYFNFIVVLDNGDRYKMYTEDELNFTADNDNNFDYNKFMLEKLYKFIQFVNNNGISDDDNNIQSIKSIETIIIIPRIGIGIGSYYENATDNLKYIEV